MILLALCLAAAVPSKSVMEEVRIALYDAQKAYHAQAIEIQVLQEDMAKLKTTQNLEKKIAELEATINKMALDLKELKNHANATTTTLKTIDKELAQQKEKLNDVVKLKSTLNSISKAIGSSKIHKVQAGDSLEKIARQYNTSVESLKSANGLTGNTIIKGQDLKIP